MLDLAQLQSETLEQSHIAPLAKEHLQMSVSLEDSIQEMKWQSQLFASQPGTGYSGFLNGEVGSSTPQGPKGSAGSKVTRSGPLFCRCVVPCTTLYRGHCLVD